MRLRVIFSKGGALRYIGHLDLQRIWERTIRRADLPLAYSQGFHPGPKLQLAAALPLGCLGRAEILDMWLQEEFQWDGEGEGSEKKLCGHLQAAAPDGLQISHVYNVDDGLPALQTQVIASEYAVEILDPIDQGELQGRVDNLMESKVLPRERRGKPYDLRPLLEAMEIKSPSTEKPISIKMILAGREGATGRPDEVIAALGISPESTRVERLRIILKGDRE
jgi:radical SAM-linked protein